jgi:transposase InsO family protein
MNRRHPRGHATPASTAKRLAKAVKKFSERARPKEVGALIHSDLWGPSPTRTPQHKEYYVSYTDDHTRYSVLYLIRTKDETFETYEQYEAWLWTQFSARIKELHTDRGGEYLSKEFSAYLATRGTKRNLAVHHVPGKSSSKPHSMDTTTTQHLYSSRIWGARPVHLLLPLETVRGKI